MRLVLALCVLLALPAAALAREPVISYVDENGVFRLYDAETETETELPVAANFLGFRYGISLNGRYVVFNDDPPERNLHLLDRATNTEVPLPGINVYTIPGGLTVSDAGLIAFDNNGNGPALVYDSATGQFRDVGMAADNGHRQTRLSADGLYLATTCVSSCENSTGGDADPFLQDIPTATDTMFPDEDGVDEEHPCVDGDASVFGIDKRRSAAVMERDIFLFDRSQSPPQAIDVSGAMAEDEAEVSCVLDRTGEYLGFFNNTTAVFRVWHIATGQFLSLPPGAEFDNFSLFSAPYTQPAPDTTRPVASRFRMSKRRFRPRRRATVFRFVLSEPGNVRLLIRRRGGRRVGVLSYRNRPAGLNRIRFNGRVRGRALRPGRYVAVLTVTDAAGNASVRRVVRFRVLARRRAR